MLKWSTCRIYRNDVAAMQHLCNICMCRQVWLILILMHNL